MKDKSNIKMFSRLRRERNTNQICSNHPRKSIKLFLNQGLNHISLLIKNITITSLNHIHFKNITITFLKRNNYIKYRIQITYRFPFHLFSYIYFPDSNVPSATASLAQISTPNSLGRKRSNTFRKQPCDSGIVACILNNV